MNNNSAIPSWNAKTKQIELNIPVDIQTRMGPTELSARYDDAREALKKEIHA